MDRKERFSPSIEADSRIMQTRGSNPGTLDREAELRRRNEEIDMRQHEALRIAQAVVRQQEAKLALSPSSTRSPARLVKFLSHRPNTYFVFGSAIFLCSWVQQPSKCILVREWFAALRVSFLHNRIEPPREHLPTDLPPHEYPQTNTCPTVKMKKMRRTK